MSDYLNAHGSEISAMIGLGDMVMGSVKRAWAAVKWNPGKIPVVGWGNSLETAQEVSEGYVKAATWQYPDSQGFLPIALLYMAKKGMAIGYDVTTLAMYDKASVGTYLKLLTPK
jgi:simple sugar transport system substrate-binding protein